MIYRRWDEMNEGREPKVPPLICPARYDQKPKLIEPMKVRGEPIWAKGTLLVEVPAPSKPPT